MTLSSVIKELEQAQGPSRELADEVLIACGWSVEPYGTWGSCIWTMPDGEKFSDWRGASGKGLLKTVVRPNPLESLEAALSLVPDGWYPRIEPRFYDDPDRVVWWINMIKPNWPRYQAVLHGLEEFDAVGIVTHTDMKIGVVIGALKARYGMEEGK